MISTRTLFLALTLITLAGRVSAQGSDDCAGATAVDLLVGASVTFTGDNSAATPTSDFDPGSPFNGAPVIWHAFTTSECANVAVSYCGQTPAWGNVFGFLATDCPADSLVFFSTFNTTDCGDGNYTYYFDQLAAGTYLLPVVLDPGNGSVGAYSIEVSAASCALPDNNDFCDQVTPVDLNVGDAVTFTGDNSTATAVNDWAPGSPFAIAPVMWHLFTTAECANVTVNYCGQSPAWGNVFGFLATDCPADSLVFFSTFNTTDCGDGNYTYYFDQLAAGTYRLPVVLDPGNGSVGAYSIEVSAASCALPDNNDFCDQVTPVDLNVGDAVTFTGDNSTATATNDWVSGSPFEIAPVMWHLFTTSECANVTISYCGQSPAWGNVFGFLATDCPADSLVFFSTFNTTDCGDGNYTYYFDALAAGTYRLPVVLDPGNGSVGPYSIEVSAAACVSTDNNDFCDQVTPVDLSIGTPLTFTGDNSTATAVNDWTAGSPFEIAPVMWHLFTTSECVDLSVSYCGQSPAWGNVFGFLATDCPADSLVYFTTFNTTDCSDGNYTYYFDELAAGTYRLPVVLDPGNGSVGAYSIELTAEECLSTAVNAPGAEAHLVVYPNPVDDAFTVWTDDVPAGAQLELRDATGRIAAQWQVMPRTWNTLQLPASMAGGVYFLQVRGGTAAPQRIVAR